MFLIAVALLLLISGSVYSITLSELISLAAKNSPYIKESHLEKEIYRAEKSSSAAKRFGEVKLFGSFSHYEDKRILYPLSPPINPLTLKGAQNQLITGVSYTLPVFTGFKIKNTVEIAKLKHILSSYRFYLTKNELVFNIRSLYLKTLSLKKQKEAIHSYIQSLNQLQRQLKISVKEGKKPEIDLLKVKYQLEEARSNLQEISQSIESLKFAIKTYVGLKDLDLSQMEEVPLSTFETENLEKKLKNTLKIKTYTIMEEIASKKIKIQKSEYFPQVYLNVSVQRNMGADAYKNLWQVGIVFDYKLFDFGKRKGEYIKAKLEKQKTAVEKRKAILSLERKVNELINKIKSAEQKINSAKSRIEYAKEVEIAEKVKYEEGATDLYNYLYAKYQKVQADTLLYSSIYERELYITQLKYLLEDFAGE